MTDTKKEVINELYDAALLTTGVVGASYLTTKVAGKSLGAPMTLEGAAKLAVAVAGSAFTKGYLKDKGYIPKMIDCSGFLGLHKNSIPKQIT
jgi:hypothetical protein